MSAGVKRWAPGASWLALGLLVGGAMPAVAQGVTEGYLECTSVIQWRSNCEHPLFDLDARHGKQGVREAQVEFNGYQSCLVRKAQNDGQVAQKGIYDAANRELEAVKREAIVWGFTVQ